MYVCVVHKIRRLCCFIYFWYKVVSALLCITNRRAGFLPRPTRPWPRAPASLGAHVVESLHKLESLACIIKKLQDGWRAQNAKCLGALGLLSPGLLGSSSK